MKTAFLALFLGLCLAAPASAKPAVLVPQPGADDYEEGLLREKGLDGYLKEPAEAAACYERAAGKGHPAAKVRLGELLRHGADGLAADPRRAFSLFGEAARAGNPEGMEKIGSAYAFGFEEAGVEPNGEQAVKWLEKGIDAGNAHAKTILGLVRLFGLAGTESDPARGMELMGEAADAGDMAALWNCAQAFENGDWGVEKDEARALRFLRRAADAGSPDAVFRLAGAVRRGELGLEADPDPELYWSAVRKAADAGNAPAQTELAFALLVGDEIEADPVRAVDCLRQAAAQGFPAARQTLGLFLLRGFGNVVERDAGEGVRLLRAAADAGNGAAALQLGDAYDDGTAGQVDETEAFRLWKSLAERDLGPDVPFRDEIVQARNRFANAFRNGKGDENVVSVERALAWAKEAAETGDPLSMLRYAYALQSKRIGGADYENGNAWLERAATAENALPEAKQQWGMILLAREKERRPEAIRFLTEAADAGDKDAGYFLATELFKDDETSETARRYLIQAANAGHLGAKNDCAYNFAFGSNGFERNPELAERLFVDAAESGNETARCNLGLLLAFGAGGMEKDEQRGLQLILDAARNGNATAMERLGDFYAEGRFFDRDPAKAREWYRKAGVEKEIPAAEPAAAPADDDRTRVRVTAAKATGGRPYAGFFPVKGATIGKTTFDELLRMGARAASGKNARKFANYPGSSSLAWWDNDGDGICEKVQMFSSETIPDEWKALGMDLGMSYDEWQTFFRDKGFTVKTTRGPEVKDYNGRKTFVADVMATAPDDSFEFRLYFFAGNQKGEGWFSSSRNSLFILAADSKKKW